MQKSPCMFYLHFPGAKKEARETTYLLREEQNEMEKFTYFKETKNFLNKTKGRMV